MYTTSFFFKQKMPDFNLIKPIVSGGTAFAIDRFYFKQTDMQKNAIFAGAVAGTMYFSPIITDMIPTFLPDMGTFANGKQVQDRLMEVAVGGGVGYIINNVVMKNTMSNNEAMKRIGAVLVSDLVGEAFLDYWVGRDINPFA